MISGLQYRVTVCEVITVHAHVQTHTQGAKDPFSVRYHESQLLTALHDRQRANGTNREFFGAVTISAGARARDVIPLPLESRGKHTPLEHADKRTLK